MGIGEKYAFASLQKQKKTKKTGKNNLIITQVKK
jgi:hypothetical protein